jgi:hypothetical protein
MAARAVTLAVSALAATQIGCPPSDAFFGCFKGSSGPAPFARRIATSTRALRFQRQTYVDREGLGVEAFRMGGIRWVLDRTASPADAAFTVTSPNGEEVFEILPNLSFTWNTDPMMRATFPIGSRYFGSEVRPAMAAIEMLTKIVVPRFRGRVPGLRIVAQQDLPELGRAVAAAAQPEANVRKSATGAKVRLEYVLAGKPYEEEVYGASETALVSFPGYVGTRTITYWAASHLFACRAPKGQLERDASLFQTMAFSFQLSPQWFDRYSELIGKLAQQRIREIRTIGEISRIVSRTNNEISDMRRRQWESDQAAHDRINQAFSQHVRGVDEYRDPSSGHSVELPSGYQHAWSNPLGEYIVSDDPSYNPNVGSNHSWQALELTRR